jgi:hypothetical protein
MLRVEPRKKLFAILPKLHCPAHAFSAWWGYAPCRLCINYANERFQEMVTEVVCTGMQKLYEEEGVEVDEEEKKSKEEEKSKRVIDLIEDEYGLINLLDDRTRIKNRERVSRLGGEDHDFEFCKKVFRLFEERKSQYEEAFEWKPGQVAESFTICHYAGDVEYKVKGFVVKNGTKQPDTVINLLKKKSTCPFFKGIGNSAALNPSPGKMGRPSVATKFKTELDKLVKTLNDKKTTDLHFVRCIKPNPDKKPREFHRRMACLQLKSAGLERAVKVAKKGFPERLPHHEMLRIFKILVADQAQLLDHDVEDTRSKCEAFLELLKKSNREWFEQDDKPPYKIGNTMVFLRANLYRHMDVEAKKKRDEQERLTDEEPEPERLTDEEPEPKQVPATCQEPSSCSDASNPTMSFDQYETLAATVQQTQLSLTQCCENLHAAVKESSRKEMTQETDKLFSGRCGCGSRPGSRYGYRGSKGGNGSSLGRQAAIAVEAMQQIKLNLRQISTAVQHMGTVNMEIRFVEMKRKDKIKRDMDAMLVSAASCEGQNQYALVSETISRQLSRQSTARDTNGRRYGVDLDKNVQDELDKRIRGIEQLDDIAVLTSFAKMVQLEHEHLVQTEGEQSDCMKLQQELETHNYSREMFDEDLKAVRGYVDHVHTIDGQSHGHQHICALVAARIYYKQKDVYREFNRAMRAATTETGTAPEMYEDLLRAAEYAYMNFYAKKYEPEHSIPEYQVDLHVFNEIYRVHRPNHGLANAMRKALLVRPVVSACRGHSKGIEFSEAMLSAMEIAMVFESCGRNSEITFTAHKKMHKQYRDASIRALQKYSSSSSSMTDKELASVVEGLRGMYKPGVDSPAAQVFELCHELDLFRCAGEDAMRSRIQSWSRLVGTGTNARKLAMLAESAIRATGDRLCFSPSGGHCAWYNHSIFPRCSGTGSKDASECLRFLTTKCRYNIFDNSTGSYNVPSVPEKWKYMHYHLQSMFDLQFIGSDDHDIDMTCLSDLVNRHRRQLSVEKWATTAADVDPPPSEGEPPELVEKLPLPEIPPSPVSGRTLCSSKFRGVYNKAKAPANLMELDGELTLVVKGYCAEHHITYDHDEGERFCDQLRKDMHGEDDNMKDAVQRMWTSCTQLGPRGREFSFILNEVVRNDTTGCIGPAASLTRAINEKLCVTPADQEPQPPFPPDYVCVRGGGFDDKYRDFFARERMFRQPAFLATSFKESTAQTFMERSKMQAKVKWLIHIDPDRKCRHVNLVTTRAEGVPDEQEYLFTPYSVFTVRGARWASGTNDDPHVIKLDAAPDNQGPPEDLPLAPWS